LLLLPTLAADVRGQYENFARLQAVKMAKQHKLYPEIINRPVLEAALVEVRLRDTLPEQHLEDVVLPPFYVELDAPADS
jgi:hypothetical protein